MGCPQDRVLTVKAVHNKPLLFVRTNAAAANKIQNETMLVLLYFGYISNVFFLILRGSNVPARTVGCVFLGVECCQWERDETPTQAMQRYSSSATPHHVCLGSTSHVGTMIWGTMDIRGACAGPCLIKKTSKKKTSAFPWVCGVRAHPRACFRVSAHSASATSAACTPKGRSSGGGCGGAAGGAGGGGSTRGV